AGRGLRFVVTHAAEGWRPCWSLPAVACTAERGDPGFDDGLHGVDDGADELDGGEFVGIGGELVLEDGFG
ncbi:MAG TPA: hypothetical protein VE466_07150, partial [Acidimicrobiales bacterium]|nr:hypothetical protein [Acidimicrobiales bacterium]